MPAIRHQSNSDDGAPFDEAAAVQSRGGKARADRRSHLKKFVQTTPGGRLISPRSEAKAPRPMNASLSMLPMEPNDHSIVKNSVVRIRKPIRTLPIPKGESKMKKLIAPVAALAFLVSAGIAYAEDASGKIASVDAQTITLEDGTAFTIGEGVMVEGLEPGTEVTVSYEEQDGQKTATSVAPAN